MTEDSKYRILRDGKTVLNWDDEYYDILNDGFNEFCNKNSDAFKCLKPLVQNNKISIASRWSTSRDHVMPHEYEAYQMMLQHFKKKYKKGIFENIHDYIRRIAIEDIETFVSLWGNNLIGLRVNTTQEEFMPTTVNLDEFQNFFDNLPDFED